MNESLETISRILLRCGLLTMAIVLVWFLFYTFAGNMYCGIHAQLFGLTQSECSVIAYGGMGLLKIFMWVFFFAPWLAIRLEKKARESK